MGLADIVLGVGRTNPQPGQKIANIIEFVEAPWGLGMRLFPVQKVILKAHYGLALDDVEKFIISDWRRTTFTEHTEKSYLEYLFKDGRSNISEVIPGHERRELILSIGRRSGKCILGDSLVLTDRGVFRIDALGDPCGPEVQPLDIGVVQEGGVKSRSRFFYNGGVKPTRTLTTYCGFQLGGTDNHRIKVMSEDGTIQWKYLADLKVGDWVAQHRTTDLWSSSYVDTTPYHNTLGLKDLHFPDRLDERWGRLLGYLVGDGLWNYPSRTEVTVAHSETWDQLKSLYTELFGEFSVVMDPRTSNTGALKFFGLGMRKFLHDLGFRLGTDWDQKMVPWAILQSPRSVVQAFLRGLFEADGGVEAGGKTVSFCTASRRLAAEVQVLLLNFGIVSRVSVKMVKGHPYHVLRVLGLRSRRAFAREIGFDSQKKMVPLLDSVRSASREGGDTENIPHQRAWAGRLLDSVLKVQPRPGQKQKWSRSALRTRLGNTIKPGGQDAVGYPRVRFFLPVARGLGADPDVIRHFEHLQETDYFYDQVVTIEEGEQPVYDLNVPVGESFVANGFTNHNTFLASCISAYETYKLLLKGDPQTYYGLPASNNIQIISVATDKDQAGLLYNEVSGHYRNCGFFSPYTANNTMSYARFQTPADIVKFGRYADNPDAKATIKITFRSCIAKGLRGAGNIAVILDEMAHFTDDGQSSAEAVYNAVTPSTSAFSPKDPKDARIPIGPVEGRIVLISSPLGRQGQFYKLFQIGMKGGTAAQNMLCIQAPTWEVNPTVPASEFEKHFVKDATVFYTEYGADFTDRTKGWIEKVEDLMACVNPTLRPQPQGPPRRAHYLGLDIALVGDGCAASIGYIENDKIVLAYECGIKAGEGDFAGVERLDFDDVADWVYNLSRRFYIAEGLFDQWAGIPFEQALQKRGLRQIRTEHMTKQLNSDIYKNFKDMMWDQRVMLFDWPIPQGKEHSDLIVEILELQAEYQSKYVVIVEAPKVEGKHDDRSDALVRMVWLAGQRLTKQGTIVRGTVSSVSGRQPGVQGIGSKATRRLRQMGSSPDRQASRSMPGRIRGRGF